MVCLFAASVMITGCGNAFIAATVTRPLFVAECPDGPERLAADLVVIDLRGGTTPLYPAQRFEGLDLHAFPLRDGGTLGDRIDDFKEAVWNHINRIFCENDGPAVVVRFAGETRDRPGTIVYVTQALSPSGENRVGEGEFDVCNEQHDNAAVVFGEQLRRLAGIQTFDEWVRVFGNVIAHEIGHTLGYPHVARDDYEPADRALYIELMLNGHTMAELRQPHRFIVEQTNCTVGASPLLKRIDHPRIACDITNDEAGSR